MNQESEADKVLRWIQEPGVVDGVATRGELKVVAARVRELELLVSDLLGHARHTHRARYSVDGKLLDACWDCGLDVRHQIHEGG